MNKNETNTGNEDMYFKNINRKYIVIYFSYNLVNNLFINMNLLSYSYVSICYNVGTANRLYIYT